MATTPASVTRRIRQQQALGSRSRRGPRGMWPAPAVTPVLVVRGSAPDDVVDEAAEKVMTAVRHAGPRLMRVRITLDHHDDPAAFRPCEVAAQVDLTTGAVRGHAADADWAEAIDQLEARLRRGVDDHLRRRRRHHDRPGKPANVDRSA